MHSCIMCVSPEVKGKKCPSFIPLSLWLKTRSRSRKTSYFKRAIEPVASSLWIRQFVYRSASLIVWSRDRGDLLAEEKSYIRIVLNSNEGRRVRYRKIIFVQLVGFLFWHLSKLKEEKKNRAIQFIEFVFFCRSRTSEIFFFCFQNPYGV